MFSILSYFALWSAADCRRWRGQLVTSLVLIAAVPASAQPDMATGESVYRYYCYQCHGYSGDANTLASASIEPPPRNFTTASRDVLTLESMMTSINKGRPGTAMPAFDDVLNDAEIRAVAEYVRMSFVREDPATERYHSIANGWPDITAQSEAFAFVRGDIRMETATELLTDRQLRGRAIYLSACISCHEQSQKNADAPVWELRAVSYPRKHYSHRDGALDAVSSASPYAVHDEPVVPDEMSAEVALGLELYQQNCAFCHAADGTGSNWIGSFMVPRPRNFGDPIFVSQLADRSHLVRVVRDGIVDTSMPAWRDVLDEQQINAVVSYLQAAFIDTTTMKD